MKNAIIIHGMPDDEAEYRDASRPSQSNSHWLPWLQQQLITRDILAATPDMPFSFKLDFATWQKEFERYDISLDTLLVGHSAGGGFLLRWLSEHPGVKVGKVVLVAPWLNPDKEFNTGTFFNFKIDKNLVKRTNGITIINSDNDYPDIYKSIDIIRSAIPSPKIIELHDMGHFTQGGMHGRTDFPELLKECTTAGVK